MLSEWKKIFQRLRSFALKTNEARRENELFL